MVVVVVLGEWSVGVLVVVCGALVVACKQTIPERKK